MNDELHYRKRMISAGVWITWALALSNAIWVAATWTGANRPVIAALIALAALSGGVVSRLPHERILASAWREPFFLGWSAGVVAILAAIAVLDAGAASPVLFALVLPLLFAALSYPLGAVAAVTALALLAVLVVFLLGSHEAYVPGLAHLWSLLTTIAITGWVCGWQARLQAGLRGELARLSRADPLTGALNRRGFAERLVGKLARDARAVALVLLDLDDFKAVNDTHGHAAGDELLCWVVAALGGLLRPGDAVGRLGGDEFAILLPGTDRERAQAVAVRVGAALAERVRASAGVAAFPVDGRDPETLHRHADAALYAAKRAAAPLPALLLPGPGRRT